MEKDIVKVIKATAFTCLDENRIKIYEDVLFMIDSNGIIDRIVEKGEKEYHNILKEAITKKILIELKDGEYLIPGMIDLHIHAPQWAQAGTALDKELSEWLSDYTFPLEAKFSDIHFADKVYNDLVDCLISNGTTTAMYYATVHQKASELLASICLNKGQRALVGKVVMDDKNNTPNYYQDKDVDTAIKETEEFIKNVTKLCFDNKLKVYPVVTPRFIPTCSDEVLTSLGKLANKYDTYIQTHCSESQWEHNFIFERFNMSDSFALHKFELLTNKSFLGHCGYLTDEDMSLLSKVKANVVHCPISNVYFANKITEVAKLNEQYKVNVTLGTDISGGFSPSTFDSIRQAIIAARNLEDLNNGKKITLIKAFSYATYSAGKALDLNIGTLLEGYSFDALKIDINNKHSLIPHYDDIHTLEDLFEKIIYLVKPSNITEVWVQGESIHKK